jgi:SAM-dependent methyltransferase
MDAEGFVLEGDLTTGDGRHVYPVVRGIPRFVVQESYAGSFGYEWRKWSRVQYESENAGRPMAGHTTRMFETITGWTGDELRGKLVVEFGCGGGRFLDVVRRKGGVAVGLDLSEAVEPARESFRNDPDVLIVQGDVLHPPFKPAAFDHGYTIGVLHHTPDPAGGVRALARVVRPGGTVSCTVYSRRSFYAYPSLRAYRAVYRRLAAAAGAPVARRFALAYATFAAAVLYPLFYLPRKFRLSRYAVTLVQKYLLVSLNLPDFRWRVLDVFDAVTPTYASTHTGPEVAGWLRAAGLADVRPMPWADTSYLGLKAE